MIDRTDLASDPRIVQRVIAFWRNGYHGFFPTYYQALALILLRYDVYCGRYADDRAPAAEGE